MEESPTAEIQEEANVNENSGSQREANGPSENALQNGEGGREANLLNGVLAINITEMLERLEPPLSRVCCIYRVPRDLCKLNEEAYSPQVISIGPFHRGVEKLEAMEKHKLRSFKIFVEKAELNMENLVSIIRNREGDVRHCYSESSGLGSDDYVKMILLDASFIIVFFLNYAHDQELMHWDESTTFTQRLMATVSSDIWLLENQLPYFVIEELYNFAFVSRSNYPSFAQLTLQWFERRGSGMVTPQDEDCMSLYPTLKTLHFVDLVRTISLLSSQRLQKNKTWRKRSCYNLYTASQLDEARVKFKVGLNKCLFDLKFTNGVLEIPRLTLFDDTESLFRNLMAWEQCHYDSDRYVTDYISMLDFLINTVKDVDLLVEKRILVNTLGDSNAVTTMVNKLSQKIYGLEMNSYYCEVCKDLNAFYGNPWQTWKATWHTWKVILNRDYFSTPWKTASTVAAIILLVLTFIQTVRSFY